MRLYVYVWWLLQAQACKSRGGVKFGVVSEELRSGVLGTNGRFLRKKERERERERATLIHLSTWFSLKL